MAGSTRAFRPAWLERGRAFGLSFQLYELRSARNWGIGDFADLEAMIDIAAAAGAEFVGINPQHAPFLADPERASPYRPSSRLFLNPLSIAPDTLPGFVISTEERRLLAALREADEIDYRAVADVKLAALGRYWRSWQAAAQRGGDSAVSLGAYAEFCERRGEALRRHALFEALSFDQVKNGGGAGWRSWPKPLQSPETGEVHEFARSAPEAVQFHMFLQFLAERQLQAAAEKARRAGLRLGLYLDLAVGEAPDGSATWSAAALYRTGERIGYPPDPISRNGQDWGLAALDPDALRETGAAPFSALLSAVMAPAGVLRIDHAAGLARLYLIPEGKGTDGGRWVTYPRDLLVRAATALSRLQETLLIAEDLGKMPPGLSQILAANRILSTRLLIESMRGQSFLPPKEFKRGALAMIATHDHAPLGLWLSGGDLRLREKTGLLDAAAAEEQAEARATAVRALLRAFIRQDFLDGPLPAPGETPRPEDFSRLAVAAYRYLGRTPSMLVALRLADLFPDAAMTNLPGTEDAYPNWRPRLPIAVEQLGTLPLFKAVTEALLEERPRPA